MKTPVLVLFAMLAIPILVVLVVRNQKDKKQLEDDLNQDLPKFKDEEGDVEID